MFRKLKFLKNHKRRTLSFKNSVSAFRRFEYLARIECWDAMLSIIILTLMDISSSCLDCSRCCSSIFASFLAVILFHSLVSLLEESPSPWSMWNLFLLFFGSLKIMQTQWNDCRYYINIYIWKCFFNLLWSRRWCLLSLFVHCVSWSNMVRAWLYIVLVRCWML